MKKKLITTFLFLATLSSASACVCYGLDKETTQELFEKADYVIIGTPISNSAFDSRTELCANMENVGANVLLQVESVFKGDVEINENLFIYQFQTSCTQIFQMGEKYLIFGKKIIRFTKAKSENKNSGELSPPPPPPSVKNGLIELYADNKEVKFLNNQTLKYKTITTDKCSSISVDAQGFATTIEYLKIK